MRKNFGSTLLFIFLMTGLSRAVLASEIKGEVISVDLDTRAINVKVRNAFTKKESSERLIWVMNSPEGRALRELKPGDYVRVDAIQGELGRYLVKKVIKARMRSQK